MIHITFPDGAVREFESGVTTFEIAQSISNSLAKKALAGKFNGKLIDTTRAITEDGSIEIVTPDHYGSALYAIAFPHPRSVL